jgi:ribosomal protein L16 Arg81 hydroxylase
MNYSFIDLIDCSSAMDEEWITSMNEQFRTLYRMKKPVCLKNGAKDWPALWKWNDPNYFSSSLMTPEIGESKGENTQETLLVANDGQTFLKHELCQRSEMDYRQAIQLILSKRQQEQDSQITTTTETTTNGIIDHQRMYCRLYFDHQPLLAADTLHQELASIFLPNPLSHPHPSSPSLQQRDLSSFEPKNCGIWISSSGCVTPLHYDLCHGLLVQVSGTKRFLLASPQETIYLSPNKDPFSKNQTSSQVNLTKWISDDLEEKKRFPAIDEARWYSVDLSPGDVLYTPPGWWHYVVSLEESISVLLPFDMSAEEHLHPLQCL